jgi:hypothetical protein
MSTASEGKKAWNPRALVRDPGNAAGGEQRQSQGCSSRRRHRPSLAPSSHRCRFDGCCGPRHDPLAQLRPSEICPASDPRPCVTLAAAASEPPPPPLLQHMASGHGFEVLDLSTGERARSFTNIRRLQYHKASPSRKVLPTRCSASSNERYRKSMRRRSHARWSSADHFAPFCRFACAVRGCRLRK